MAGELSVLAFADEVLHGTCPLVRGSFQEGS